MKRIDEHPFKFLFPDGTDCKKHDSTLLGDDGNKIWQGIDIRVVEHSREVWVEVKCWSFKKILERARRHATKRDFQLRAASVDLRNEIVQKFLTTTAFLSWSRIGVPEKVLFEVFLEPPNAGSSPLLGPSRDALRDEFKNAQSRPWGNRIAFRVVDKQGCARLFTTYQVDWL